MALNLPRFSSPRFIAIHPSTGRPVSFGWVKFYVAGTTTAKDVYANSDGAALASLNASGGVPLDEAGSCAVFLSGPYRVEVYDNKGALVYDADKINSIAVDLATGNPGSLIAANNLSDVDDVPTARASLGLVKQREAVGDHPEWRADPVKGPDRFRVQGAPGGYRRARREPITRGAAAMSRNAVQPIQPAQKAPGPSQGDARRSSPNHGPHRSMIAEILCMPEFYHGARAAVKRRR